jgi:hypothetical protein
MKEERPAAKQMNAKRVTHMRRKSHPRISRFIRHLAYGKALKEILD